MTHLDHVIAHVRQQNRPNSHGAVLLAEIDILAAENAELRLIAKAGAELIDAMDRVLDDMGKDGLSVCSFAKAKARIAFEPFLDPECVEFVMSLDEAKRIVKECDVV